MAMSSLPAKMEQTVRPGQRELDRLLLAVGAGDREAFGEVYERTRAAVYATVLGVLGDHHEAQDVTQDTFVRIWEASPGYRSQGSPMAWVLTIARRLALMSLRQGARQGELTPGEWEAIPGGEGPSEEALILRETLGTLEGEERQIILLHALSGLKHREIASLMTLPLSTVLSKYSRGLKKLKKRLEGEEKQ